MRPKRTLNQQSAKARHDKWKKTGNTHQGRLSFNYSLESDKEALFTKIDKAKNLMQAGKGTGITTFEMLNRALDIYIEQNDVSHTQAKEQEDDNSPVVGEFQLIGEDQALEEELYLCTLSSINHLLAAVAAHSKRCPESFTASTGNRLHHVLQANITCSGGHRFTWTSSPHVEGGNFLANLRVAHGFFISGMLPNQFLRFCSEANIGHMGDKYMKNLSEDKGYYDICNQMASESTHEALREEIAAQVVLTGDNTEGIDILTDARHCWRKNAKFSDVVCLGYNTHKVLRVETITKEDDDPVSQRHEMIGVKKIYKYLDTGSPFSPVPVRLHSHDNNASVSKFVNEERQPTENAKDTWHAAKGLSREAKKITAGTKKAHGATWHHELSDKAASLRTGVYYAMKNCGGDDQRLRDIIDNIPEHYQGNHQKCSATSRCKTDVPFVSTKCLLTDPVAVKILVNFLHKLVPYKDADSYKSCRDTHYVESFNNALLQYHDKRICFGLEVYKFKMNLAILDWNEHIDRPSTSVSTIQEIEHLRRKAPQKVLSKKTNCFRENLWQRWIRAMDTR